MSRFGKTKEFKSKQEFKRFYDEHSVYYDQIRSTDIEGRFIDKVERRIIFDVIDCARSPKVLDCGCGTGRILLPLSKAGCKVTGIDASEGMLKELKRKAREARIKSITLVGDIENLPFDDNSFECVYSFKVLLHLKTFKKAVREMMRVTKSGGKVIFDIQNKHCPWWKLSFSKTTTAHSLKKVEAFLQGVDYRKIALFSYPSFCYRLPLLGRVVPWLEKFFPLPFRLRRKFVFIVRKG